MDKFMFKRMTAEIIRTNGSLPGSFSKDWCIVLRDLKTGKRREFEFTPYLPYGGESYLTLIEEDIIEIEYTEPSGLLSFMSYPKIVRIITKVRCSILEKQLVKIPKTGAFKSGNVRSIVTVLSDSIDCYNIIKLKGSLEHIVMFVYKTIQQIES